MPNQSHPDPPLTPEAIAVLEDINEETRKLRELDLIETPPASGFEAG